MFNMSKRVKKPKWWYLCQLYLDVVLFQQVINNITQEHSDRCVIILPHVNLISELSAMDTIWYSNTLRPTGRGSLIVHRLVLTVCC